MIIINDGMAVARRRLERDMARFSIRQWLSEIDATQGTVIWAWDGAHNKKLRQADYPRYKTNRKPALNSIYEGIKFFRQALTHTKSVQIEVPGYEADDVIAAIAMRAAGGCPVKINTVDGDLRQLCAIAPNISCNAPQKEGVDDVELRLYKATVGDSSDAVQGIPKFGPKAWADVDKDALLALVTADAPTEALVECLPKPGMREWAMANHAELKAMWKVVGFYPLDDATLNKHMVIGASDTRARDNILKDFFL